MGHLLASELKKAGAQVTLIEGPVTNPMMQKGIKVIKYRFFDELALALKRNCAKYDVVVHAAAVSDFKPAYQAKKKIRSGQTLNLKLVPTGKLIDHIKRLAPKIFLVGFKLEDNITESNAYKIGKSLFGKAKCDLVVANSIQKGYKGFIVAPDGRILNKAASKTQLAKSLVRNLF